MLQERLLIQEQDARFRCVLEQILGHRCHLLADRDS